MVRKQSGRGLRVIAGEVGGLRLVAPERIRPTAERVREALFSALGGEVEGASVLDLYAGSGALAIEALSRGAAGAVLVDHDRAAVDACRRNLESTGLGSRARVQVGYVSRFLESAPPPEAPFDLVLSDPPYDTPESEVLHVLALLEGGGWLAPQAIVIVERSSRGSTPWPAAWAVQWERRYGDTLIASLTAPSG